jgi:hypothetical protein
MAHSDKCGGELRVREDRLSARGRGEPVDDTVRPLCRVRGSRHQPGSGRPSHYYEPADWWTTVRRSQEAEAAAAQCQLQRL